MFRLRRKDTGGGTALAEPPTYSGTTEELRAEIARLADANRARPDRETERRLLALRHLHGVRLVEAAEGDAEFAPPDASALPPESEGLPEFTRADLTPGLLRAAILRDGCCLVRGLVERQAALDFAAQIDRAYAERDSYEDGRGAAAGYYEEFVPVPGFGSITHQRPWIKEGGGLLAVDAPLLHAEMLELYRAAELPALVDGYLGEPGMITDQKTTLRKADPSVSGSWHQDGAFMGPVRALNLWLSLSRCGDESPGLDIVPRRLDHFVTRATEEAVLDFTVSQSKAEEAAGDKAILRPIFEPGDALLFDDLFLHQTGSDPSMPKPRFAVESWFFGASGWPGDYGPIAIR